MISDGIILRFLYYCSSFFLLVLAVGQIASKNNFPKPWELKNTPNNCNVRGEGSNLAHSHLPPPLCPEEFNIVPRIHGMEDSSFL